MGGGVINSVAVAVDNVTLELNAGLLKIKDAGVAAAQLAASVQPNGWIFVEEKTQAANGTTFDFNTAINGDVDGDYMITGQITPATSGESFQLRINGATASGQCQYLSCLSTTLTGAAVASYTIMCHGTQNQPSQIMLTLLGCQTGKLRTYNCIVTEQNGSVATKYDYAGLISTPNSATNITSIGIYSYGATGIKAGTKLTLYKRKAV
jgi:hypothetical protein